MALLLSNRNFTRLWLSQIISLIGDKFYSIALSIWILETTGSPALMSILLIASTVPGLIVGPFAGALIDRWNRKTIMIIADIIRAVVVASIALLSEIGNLVLWEIIAAAVIISITSDFFTPALSAVIPLVVKEERLGEANSLTQLGNGITSVLGPAFGAVILSFLGYSVIFSLNALSFLISAILIAISYIPRTNSHIVQKKLTSSVIEGIRYIRSNYGIISILAVVILVHLGVGILMVALPFLAKSLIGAAAINLGYIEAFLGVGMIAGSIIVTRISKFAKEGKLFMVLAFMGIVLFAAGILKTLNVSSIVPFLIFSTMIGAIIAAASITWTTLLQRGTPDSLRGRIFGISTTLGNATFPLGMALCGFILGYISFGVLFGLLGIILIVLGLLFTFIFNKMDISNKIS